MPRPPVHVPPPPKQGPSPALIGAVVAIAVVLVAVIAYVALRPDPVDTANGGDNASVTGDGTSPNALPNAGGIRVGDAGDDVPRVHVYVDFQCPWCGQLERTSGADIYQAAQDGDVLAEEADERRSAQEGAVSDRGDDADPPGRPGRHRDRSQPIAGSRPDALTLGR